MEGVEGERNEIVAGTGDETEWIFAENPTGTKNVVGPEIIAPLPANNAAGRLLFLPSHLCTVYTRLPRERRTLEILDSFYVQRIESKFDTIRIHEESYDPFERKIFFHPSKKEFAISPTDGRYVSIFDGRGGRGGKWNACKLFIISEETRAR